MTMTLFTSPVGLPKPEATDRVADGYDAIGDLADATDDAIVADRARLTALEAGRATTVAMNAGDAAEAALRTAGDNALDARLDVVEASLATDTGWVGMSLLTGWANYGSGFTGAAYRVRRGIVHLRGMVKASGIPEHALDIAALPAGARNGTLEIFTGAGQIAGAGLTDIGIRIEINNGVIRPTGLATSGGGAVAWISLSGISYPADA
jgi:hypothetical protein